MNRIKVNKLFLTFHPLVSELTRGDILNDKLTSGIDILSEKQLEVLLKNMLLNVIYDADGRYQLLESNYIYFLLKQHPAAKKMYVNLLVHTPDSEQELLELIDTLNLVQPALSLLESANKSKVINARYLQLNEMGHKPTHLSFLAKLANKCPSAFRS